LITSFWLNNLVVQLSGSHCMIDLTKRRFFI
jgi:hypothetical protein